MASSTSVRFSIFIVMLSAAVAAVVWYADSAQRPPDPERVLTISQLELHSHASLPTHSAVGAHAWQPVRLPHTWGADALQTTPLDQRLKRSYRLMLPLNVPPNRLWALYMPQVRDDAQVTLNGNTLSEFTATQHGARNGPRTLYVVIPNGAIAQGDNELLLEVAATSLGRGLLSTFYLGPASVLGPVHQQRLQQYRFFWYTVIALFLLAATGLILAQGSQNDSIYRWFAVMCLVWGLSTAGNLLTESIIGWQWLDLLLLYIRIAFIGISCLFCLNYIGEAGRRVVQTFICACIAVAIAATALRFVAPAQALRWDAPLLGILQLMAAYTGVRFISAAWRNPSRDILSLAIGGVLILVFGVHATVSQWQGSVPPPPYLSYITPLLFLVIGYVLIRRFTSVLRQAEALGQHLSVGSDPADSNTAIAAGDSPRQQLLVAERERIMRDMHDGVGGHLVSSLSILRNRQIDDPDLEEVLNQALVDLRLMIDSLDDSDGDLSGAIAMLKERTRKTLSGSGLEARWRIDEVRLPARGPADTLQILRILQEALTNVIKHADATEVAIEAKMPDPELAQFRVVDNGVGFDLPKAQQSRGLGNMHQRAQGLGARLELSSSAAGTELTLSVPNSATQTPGARS